MTDKNIVTSYNLLLDSQLSSDDVLIQSYKISIDKIHFILNENEKRISVKFSCEYFDKAQIFHNESLNQGCLFEFCLYVYIEG